MGKKRSNLCKLCRRKAARGMSMCGQHLAANLPPVHSYRDIENRAILGGKHIITHVLQFLSLDDILNMSMTCYYTYALANCYLDQVAPLRTRDFLRRSAKTNSALDQFELAVHMNYNELIKLHYMQCYKIDTDARLLESLINEWCFFAEWPTEKEKIYFVVQHIPVKNLLIHADTSYQLQLNDRDLLRCLLDRGMVCQCMNCAAHM
jgi:hypothetical protein